MLKARFTSRISCILLLAALSAAPIRMAAQASASAADTAVQSSSESKPEAAQTEEQQRNVFRLEGPLVKWTAKTFNLSATTTANLFDFVNFGIIVLLIGVPLVRVMPKLLRSRGEKVKSDIESARKMTAEANARLSAIEAKLSGLDGEIAQIRTQVEEESKQDEVRIKSTIQDESARIVAAAEQEMEASAAQARRSLRNFAADLAIDQAARQLTLTPETDRALIAEFLSDASLTDAASKAGQNGGQN